MPAQKYSRQREAIKNYLAHTKEHPSADMVYEHIRGTFPNISLGTVYRNLNLLVDTGEIQKLTLGENGDRFDGDIHPHYHFYCRECHRVYDMELDQFGQKLTESASRGFDGRIDGAVTYFYGLCSDCCRKHTS